jgi:hypothetical protein
METNSNSKSSGNKMNLMEQRSSVSLRKEKISANTIIILTGILFSTLLFLLKISWINFDWKIPFIPIMVAIQFIFLSSVIKNRYKKL